VPSAAHSGASAVEAVTPGPVSPAQQLLDRSSGVRRAVGRRRCASLYHQASMLMDGHLRIVLSLQTTIGHHQGRGQLSAPSLDRSPTSVQHHLQPGHLSRQGRPGPTGSGRRTVKSTGMTACLRPITTTSQQAIDPAPNPMLLAAPPRPTSPSCCPAFFEEAVVAHPGPLPPTPVAGLLSLNAATRWPADPAPGAATVAPLVLGQGAQDLPGQFLSQRRTRVTRRFVRHPNTVGT